MEIKAVTGGVNVPENVVLEQVRQSIRRQLPQVRPYTPQGSNVALIAGGPSLIATEREIRQLFFEGSYVVTVNGAYQWAIDHGIRPSAAIVLDARPVNASFLRTPVPHCKYFVASQCAPETFDVVAGRDVWLFHALSYEDPEKAILDGYYGKDRYSPVTGGSTVTIRALSLLRMLGFLRLDIFGFDSCWLGHLHHAYPQKVNDGDHRLKIRVSIPGQEDLHFECAPWHIRQWEDFKLWVKERGHLCDLRVHGEGMIATLMRAGAKLIVEKEQVA